MPSLLVLFFYLTNFHYDWEKNHIHHGYLAITHNCLPFLYLNTKVDKHIGRYENEKRVRERERAIHGDY